MSELHGPIMLQHPGQLKKVIEIWQADEGCEANGIWMPRSIMLSLENGYLKMEIGILANEVHWIDKAGNDISDMVKS